MGKFDDLHTPEMAARRKAGSDPTRLRILELFSLRERWTAKELGQELGLDPNRLYYHLRILEEAKFIEVVGAQAAGRMAERIFAGIGLDQLVVWDSKDPVTIATHFASFLEALRASGEQAIYDMAQAIHDMAEAAGSDYKGPWFTYGGPAFPATFEDIAEFHERFRALVEEFRQRSEERDDQTVTSRLKISYVLQEQRVHEGSLLAQ